MIFVAQKNEGLWVFVGPSFHNPLVILIERVRRDCVVSVYSVKGVVCQPDHPVGVNVPAVTDGAAFTRC